MNKRSSFLKVYIIPCFAATFIMAIFLLTFSVNIYAAGEDISNYPIPYKFSERHDYNTWDSDNDLYNSIMNSIYNYGLPVNDPNYVLILTDFQPYASEGSYLIYRSYYLLVPIDVYTSYYSTFNNNSFSFDILNDTCYYFGVHFDIRSNGFTPIVFNVNNNPTFNHYMFGHSSTSVYNGLYKFTAYVPYYFSKDFYDDQDRLILDYSESPIVNPIGHATEPDPYDDPVYNTGHVKPTTVPQLTINNYSWTTAPTPDLSTLENTAKSIYNFLSWLASNLLGEFSNLITNLGNIGNYIGSTIQYYGNLIISTIQNAITTFYNNMVSLFEPIADMVNKIGVIAATIVALGSDENGVFSIPVLIQTLFLPGQEDVAEIISANDSLHIASTIDIFVDKVWVSENSIIKTLHNVTPAKKFHIPSCYYHGVQIGNFDIDFSWFEPYKSYSDIVIGSFLAIGWIYWFFVSCSHLLRFGKSYEFENGDGEQQKGIFF